MNILLLDIALADKTGCRIKDVNFAMIVQELRQAELKFVVSGTANGIDEAIILGC